VPPVVVTDVTEVLLATMGRAGDDRVYRRSYFAVYKRRTRL
jgi:hypothetical protein